MRQDATGAENAPVSTSQAKYVHFVYTVDPRISKMVGANTISDM